MLFGQTTHQYGLSENNIILVFFIYLYVHLQHTELWISFSGWLGRLFMSPAHHQIDHSRNPDHFNKNLGSCLALWDWMFGTLYVPSAEPEKLEFGVEPDREHAHTIRGEFIAPFGRAALLLTPLLGRRSADVPAPLPIRSRFGDKPGEFRLRGLIVSRQKISRAVAARRCRRVCVKRDCFPSAPRLTSRIIFPVAPGIAAAVVLGVSDILVKIIAGAHCDVLTMLSFGSVIGLVFITIWLWIGPTPPTNARVRWIRSLSACCSPFSSFACSRPSS